MIPTLYILLQPKNSRSLKAVRVVTVDNSTLESCAALIRSGGYSPEYDVNGDGYLTAADYNALYNIFYGKWDSWHTADKQADIRTLVRIKRYISGLTPTDSAYDLDNDGVVTRQDAVICRKWLLDGKIAQESFDGDA